jgi:hypothetical protein
MVILISQSRLAKIKSPQARNIETLSNSEYCKQIDQQSNAHQIEPDLLWICVLRERERERERERHTMMEFAVKG